MATQNMNITDRKQGAILGAAVADAASLGFHWLYDQDRIKALAPEAPEFRLPAEADYADVPGFFAHAHKRGGEFTQYGEQHQTMLRTLSQNHNVYDKSNYEAAFVECFGYGGSYHGYIDHPTRDTLNNLSKAENTALERAMSLPFTGDDTLKRKLVTKVLSNAKQARGEMLKQRVEASVRTTDDDDYLVEHAFNIINEIESINGYHGADDTQLPALSKLPALVAAYTHKDDLLTVVDSAVRVTNNNDTAAAFGAVASRMIEAAIITGSPERVVEAAKTEYSDTVSPLLDQALSELSKTTPEVTQEWGMACQLKSGFPSAVHNIAKSESYTDAIRQNIYAAGDSCGRSILIGAVMGACYGVGTDSGVPQHWIAKLRNQDSLEQAVKQLLG